MQELSWFEMSFQVAGGLGLFFFGLKSLSEGLQAIGSQWMRKMIQSLTSNRFLAVLVGLAVTAFVQSSSITTVMIVSFVNAGLMNLSQAIGVIMGANIGTTITGWIISVKVGKYALLFVALGIAPLIFSRNERISSWGKTFFALGLIFLGLETMSDAFKPLRNHQAFLNWMTLIDATHYFSLLGAIAIGCILTCIVQSSSAMLAITIALASSGALTFQTAAALVMGENIGTTITALLAGFGANVAARRAALSHALFNSLGVLGLSLVFLNYVSLIEYLIPKAADTVNAMGEKPYIAAHIAAAHTLFNVINVLIFLPLLGPLKSVVTWLVPDRAQKEIKHLELFGPTSVVSPTLAIEAAHREIEKMLGLVKTSFESLQTYVFSETEKSDLKKQIDEYEDITDNIHTEMTVFLGQIMSAGLTQGESAQVRSLLRMADEAESICDYIASMAKYAKRAFADNLKLDGDTREELKLLLDLTFSLFQAVNAAVIAREPINPASYNEAVDKINRLADEMKNAYLLRLQENKFPALGSLIVSDITVALRRIKNHTVNLKEAYALE